MLAPRKRCQLGQRSSNGPSACHDASADAHEKEEFDRARARNLADECGPLSVCDFRLLNSVLAGASCRH